MIRQTLSSIFKPTIWTAIILGIFIPMSILGYIQTYGFSYDEADEKDHPPPFLYDQIQGYPFWTIWVFSIAPLIPFTTAVQSSMVNYEYSKYLFMAMNFIYYYLISCTLSFVWITIRKSGINAEVRS